MLDDTLKLIQNPSADERDVLGCFDYQDNFMVVHLILRLCRSVNLNGQSWCMSTAQENLKK